MIFLHHISHINNLENILKNGLKSRNELLSQDIDFEDTADCKIVEKRGILNNYIPFHINWVQKVHKIPYNYTICNNNGYDNMIFLWVDPIKALEKYSMKYFLYHPISSYCMEFDNLEDVSAIGAIIKYITEEKKKFQPMGPNFGIIKSLNENIRDKKEKYRKLSERAIEYLKNSIKGV